MEKLNELMKKMADLQNRINSCEDDAQALLIQEELVDLLKDSLEDEQVIDQLTLLNVKG